MTEIFCLQTSGVERRLYEDTPFLAASCKMLLRPWREIADIIKPDGDPAQIIAAKNRCDARFRLWGQKTKRNFTNRLMSLRAPRKRRLDREEEAEEDGEEAFHVWLKDGHSSCCQGSILLWVWCSFC